MNFIPAEAQTRVNDADRQILFGLVAIRLKLVTLAQVSRALADWSTNGERLAGPVADRAAAAR